jgi:predicted GIY-YIG superfamily endonuclease
VVSVLVTASTGSSGTKGRPHRRAIAREKDIKKWRRAWKIKLIEEMNPEWKDLYETLNR